MDDEMMHPMLLFQDYKGWTMKACMQAGTCGNARGVPQEGHRRNGRRTLIPERLLLARQVGHFKCRPTVRCMCHVSCVMCGCQKGKAKGRQKGDKRDQGWHLDQIFAAWIAEEMSAW